MSPRTSSFLALIGLLLAVAPGAAQDKIVYKIVTEGRVQQSTRDLKGQPKLYITVQFRIEHAGDGKPALDVAKEEIVVEEDNRRVKDLEIYHPRAADPLTVVLVLDSSGSMAKDRKLDDAKAAARLFLDTLHAKVNCGLILFDHRMLETEPPASDPDDYANHRDKLRRLIDAARPQGGTAYIDATAKAIEMLKGVKGRKAVLLMTDGIDLNSKNTLADVKRLAQEAQVPVYTLGVGEPGKREPVTTVLVLDRSGSMGAPADDDSRVPKIKALHQAAGKFVDLMRPGARTTLLPFGSLVEIPEPFSDQKEELKRAINRLRPEGETALFDAVFAAVETLEAGRPEGKRAVVALTDGVDNKSRRRVKEVIERAKEAGIPLHLLGLGRLRGFRRLPEIDVEVMKQMASETGGQYHHARNEDQLIQIFESLSIDLHDDGFDHQALTDLASATGGKFYHARNAKDLHLYYRELAEELQTTYTVTFPSSRPSHDGTSRGIDIIVLRNGIAISDRASLGYQVHGVVLAQMHPAIYLGMLTLLGVLLSLPAGIRKLYRFYGGT